VPSGAEFAFPVQALTATIDSMVTLPAARNRRLVTSISPIPVADSNIRLTDCYAARDEGSFAALLRHTSVSSCRCETGI
jgi:hypothetical protein